jgi:hypothetical protein
MKNCHSQRSHPEVAQQDWGKPKPWQKKEIHGKVRKFYKNKKWLAYAIIDEEPFPPQR